MKTLLLLLPLALTLFASQAFAGQGYGRRYQADYRSFDTGFNRQYHYKEVDSRCGRYNTCMQSTFTTTSIVYVEEVVIYDRVYGEQRMIHVYDSPRYETTIVTYYVTNDPAGSYVRGRRFNEHHRYYNNYYYYTPYVMPGLALTTAIMDHFDDQSAALLLAGGAIFDLGINIATGCKTKECAEVGGIIALIGGGSAVSASISNEARKNRKTELELKIELEKKSSADNVQ